MGDFSIKPGAAWHQPPANDSLVLITIKKWSGLPCTRAPFCTWGISFGPLASHSATSASVTRPLGIGDMAIFDHFLCRMLGQIFHSYQFQLDRWWQVFFLLEGFLQDPFSCAKSDSSGRFPSFPPVTPWDWHPGKVRPAKMGASESSISPSERPGSKRIFTNFIQFPRDFRHRWMTCPP